MGKILGLQNELGLSPPPPPPKPKQPEAKRSFRQQTRSTGRSGSAW